MTTTTTMQTDQSSHQHRVTTYGGCRFIRVMDGDKHLLDRFDHGSKVALIRVPGGWRQEGIDLYRADLVASNDYKPKDFGDMAGFLHFVENNREKVGAEFCAAVRELIGNTEATA